MYLHSVQISEFPSSALILHSRHRRHINLARADFRSRWRHASTKHVDLRGRNLGLFFVISAKYTTKTRFITVSILGDFISFQFLDVVFCFRHAYRLLTQRDPRTSHFNIALPATPRQQFPHLPISNLAPFIYIFINPVFFRLPERLIAERLPSVCNKLLRLRCAKPKASVLRPPSPLTSQGAIAKHRCRA